MLLCNCQNTRKYIFQYFAVFVATLCMLADGMQFAWTSPAIPKLLAADSLIPMTKEESNWVTQFYLIGNVGGVFVSMAVFNKISRKFAIFAACFAILIGWIGNLFATSLVILLVTRFTAGIGKNLAYVSVPMYIGEIADPNIRGILGNFIYMMMNIGVLIVYAVTPFVSLNISSIVGVIFAVIPIIFIKLIPESPYYLLMQNNPEKAKTCLQSLRNTNDVQEELETLSVTIERQTEDKSTITKLFTVKSNRKALFIILVLRFAQMFCGVTVMTMNIHIIFKEAGSEISSEISALVYAVFMLASSFVSMGVMDRFGRKPLMLISCVLVAMSLATQGMFFYFKTCVGWNTSSVFWLPIVNTVFFVITYRLGLGTIPIVMLSELFPANVKVYGVVLADLMCSVAAFTSVVLFQFTEDTLGMYMPFLIFSGFSVGTAIFSQQMLPETKGITLEEIQFQLINKSTKPDQHVKLSDIDLKGKNLV